MKKISISVTNSQEKILHDAMMKCQRIIRYSYSIYKISYVLVVLIYLLSLLKSTTTKSKQIFCTWVSKQYTDENAISIFVLCSLCENQLNCSNARFYDTSKSKLIEYTSLC